MDDTMLLRCAMEFCVSSPRICLERAITLTRRTNHGTLIPDGKWVAVIQAGGLNPWYLGRDGRWRYKCYGTWDSPQELVQFIQLHAETLVESYAAAA